MVLGFLNHCKTQRVNADVEVTIHRPGENKSIQVFRDNHMYSGRFYRWVTFVEVWEAEDARVRKKVWTALPNVLELKGRTRIKSLVSKFPSI